MIKHTWLLLILAAFEVGCGSHVGDASYSSGSTKIASVSPGPDTTPAPGASLPPVILPSLILATPTVAPAPIQLCTMLDFAGIHWPSTVGAADQKLMMLALTMSGSFEGRTGWINLTNNFDGQGLSMGILNQNLGQGSLQPMWVEMRNAALARLQATLSKANLKSLLTMLGSWEVAVSTASLALAEYGYNELDDPSLVAQELGLAESALNEVRTAALSRNQSAVNWAAANLYTGKLFKTEWSQQLSALAVTPEYRSIQVEKALKIHLNALALMKTYGMQQLRAYLFFYDVIVQNGSLSSTVQTDYKVWAAKNPKATELARLSQILTLRLRTVLPQYVNDVFTRKNAIIQGTGVIHAEARNFPKEYCVNLTQSVL